MQAFTSDLGLLILIGIPTYWVCLVIYRLTLHPLAKYPGPFLARITSWYDVYHCYRKDRHVDQYRCQQKYGKVFRYGPNYLVMNTTEGLKDIYANGKTNNVQKSKMYSFLHEKGSCSTHTAIDRDLHAFKRRVLGQAFSEQALRNLESLMIETIDTWLVALSQGSNDGQKGWSEPKDMAAWSNYLTFDVLGDLCFGKSFGMLQSPTLRGVTGMLMNRARNLQILGNSPVRKLYKLLQEKLSLEPYLFPGIYSQIIQLREFAGNALKERFALAAEREKSGAAQRKDFVYYLQKGKDPVTGNGYSQVEMLLELRLLIIAGSDTSSTTMAAVFFYLTRNPDVLQRLQKELRDTFVSIDEIVTGPKIASCHYLRAVIDETLRMAPPVPSSLPREVLPGGITIDSHAMPAGVNVGTSAFAIHRSEEYFREPLQFKPERWLPEHTPADEIAQAKKAFCPFSLGNRGCIGKPMAYNELSIALGRAFWLYDVRLASGDRTGADLEGQYELEDCFVAQRHGPLVEFRKHES